MPSPLTLPELLSGLASQGLLDDAGARAAERFVAIRAAEPRPPWYLQGLVAAGAWGASIFFCAFFGVAGLSDKHAILAVGLGLIAGATALQAFVRNLFVRQFCLATSVAGHVMALIGVVAIFNWHRGSTLAAASVALCVGLYPLYRDPLHRFLSVGSALVFATIHIAQTPHALHGLVLAETAALVAIFARRHVLDGLRPVGYALAIALPATLVVTAVPELRLAEDWPPRLFAAGGLAWAILWAGRGARVEPVALALAATAAVAAVGVAGLLAAGILLVLGYARWDRAFLGLGIASLAAFLFIYYYSLSSTLLDKSIALAGSGAMLLLFRALLVRRPWAKGAA